MRPVLAILAAALGCTSAVQPDGGTAGGRPLGDGGPTACDHYYAAQFTRCGGPQLPAAEAARQLARFEQVCQNEAALPGSGVTAATLDACADALDLSPCEFPAGPPQACQFHGTLPGGSPCADGIQCQSGRCGGTQSFSPEGPTGPAVCGTCANVTTVGQPCGQADCPAASACILDNPGGSTYSCKATSDGTQGASCDDLTTYCQPGLYCAAQTATCQPVAAVGAACGDGSRPPGDPGGCAAPYGCEELSMTCVSSPDGGPCLSDFDCAPGLGCIPEGPCANPARFGCSASGQCVPITWAQSGQPCSLAVRCLVGSCFSNESLPMVQAPNGGLLWSTCPAVVADDQPCNARSTCDAFAECFQGACILSDAVSCQ